MYYRAPFADADTIFEGSPHTSVAGWYLTMVKAGHLPPILPPAIRIYSNGQIIVAVEIFITTTIPVYSTGR